VSISSTISSRSSLISSAIYITSSFPLTFRTTTVMSSTPDSLMLDSRFPLISRIEYQDPLCVLRASAVNKNSVGVENRLNVAWPQL
ncbi:hypothetical protein ACFL6S_36625, partial [Candidatus Poribacteria bacterium]